LLSPPTPLEAVASRCDLSRFACGEISLDDWLKKRARSAEGRTARTYVVCDDDRVVGYYCLSSGEADRDHLPKRAQRNTPDPTPVFVLGRLAVDQEYQQARLGRGLVAHAFRQCRAGAQIIGALGLVVHLLKPDLIPFYSALGFEPMPDSPGSMFIALGSISAD
jgi:predicted N-acetyltransferase YhbS